MPDDIKDKLVTYVPLNASASIKGTDPFSLTERLSALLGCDLSSSSNTSSSISSSSSTSSSPLDSKQQPSTIKMPKLIMDLGDAGSGKTLFCWYLFDRLFHIFDQSTSSSSSGGAPWLPFFISLPAFRNLLFPESPRSELGIERIFCTM